MIKNLFTRGFLPVVAGLLSFSLAFCMFWSCEKDEDSLNEDEEKIDDDEEKNGEETVWVELDEDYVSGRTAATQLSIAGIDELGRIVDPSTGTKDKYVGMFYFLWLGQHTPVNVYDINWLEENDPDALWGGDNVKSMLCYHFWGKPLYGYYSMSDEWVITRHVELLTNAGIDFLGVDVSNGYTYDENLKILLDTLLKFQKQGFNVPQVMFLTYTDAIKTAVSLYENWYAGGEYDSLWFAPNGKPMISCATTWDSSYDSVMSKFDVKYRQWPLESAHDDGFAWMEWTYPQPLHSAIGEMSVSVAQHTADWMSLKDANWGRSYNFSSKVNEEGRVNEGLNYQSQWDTALQNDQVEIVFLTGWNEWQAIKFLTSSGSVYFVDEFDTEYSRDIEMMEDGYGDCYYLQTIENIRSYKSTGSSRPAIQKYTIDIDGDSGQWDYVKYIYKDFSGDAIARKSDGAGGNYHYNDNSNRNDIVTVKVATDDEYAYFYVETASKITDPDGGTEWMNILIGQGQEGGFAGYEYLINAAPDGNTTSVSKFTGDGFKYSDVGTAQLRVKSKVMQVQVALSDIGVSADNPYFIFKVCDNVTYQDDIMDYYVTGDSAPLGRLGYAYGY